MVSPDVLWISSFVDILRRCVITVWIERLSFWAICLLDSPCTTNPTISFSRELRHSDEISDSDDIVFFSLLIICSFESNIETDSSYCDIREFSHKTLCNAMILMPPDLQNSFFNCWGDENPVRIGLRIKISKLWWATDSLSCCKFFISKNKIELT